MEEQLVEQAQRGDRGAFETLTRTDFPRLFRVALGVLGDHHSAEEATQQAFVDIWRDLPRLRDVSRYETWSYRLLLRVCYRESKARRAQLAMTGITMVEATTPDVVNAIADRDQLARGFAQLSVDHRVVLVLRYLLGMSPDEVADTLGISRWTVYSRTDRARMAMRAALEADDRLPLTGADRQESLP